MDWGKGHNKQERNMIREIVRPHGRTYTIDIPEEYIDKVIEIIVLPHIPDSHISDQDADPVKNISGLLSDKMARSAKRLQTETAHDWEMMYGAGKGLWTEDAQAVVNHLREDR